MRHNAEAVYESRHRPNWQTLLTVGGCALFCVPALLLAVPTYLQIMTLGFFGTGGILMLAGSLTVEVAFRVDETGILIRKSPFRPRTTTFYDWADVGRIITWRDRSLKRLGVERHPASTAGVQDKFPDLATTITANSWHLDERRLTRAVQCFAPGVPVVDLSSRKPWSNPSDGTYRPRHGS